MAGAVRFEHGASALLQLLLGIGVATLGHQVGGQVIVVHGDFRIFRTKDFGPDLECLSQQVLSFGALALIVQANGETVARRWRFQSRWRRT